MLLRRSLLAAAIVISSCWVGTAFADGGDDEEDEAGDDGKTDGVGATGATGTTSTPSGAADDSGDDKAIPVSVSDSGGSGHGSIHGSGGVRYEKGRIWLGDGLIQLSPGMLIQLDAYGFAGPGVSDYQRPDGTGLKANAKIRRLRFELGGIVAKHFYFYGSFQGGSASQNRAEALDAFVGWDACTAFKVQFGQFRVPFTMENSGSIRWGSFMERSFTARSLGIPLSRDTGIMIWGGSYDTPITYALGYFGGEGVNRASTDNRGDVIGRVLFRPFAFSSDKHASSNAHIGISGRFGRRDRTYVRYDATAMNTPGGYDFWSPTYGSGTSATGVMPSVDQTAIAAELFLPLGPVEVRAEAMLLDEGRREAFDKSRDNTERAGTLSSKSYYVQVTVWPFGHPKNTPSGGNFGFLPGAPDFPVGDIRALEISARFEQVFAKYDSVARSADDSGALLPDVTRGSLDRATTTIRVDSFQLAVAGWITRHVRLMAQYSLYSFPGGATDNQATAPGTKASAGDPDVGLLHEVSFRTQLTF